MKRQILCGLLLCSSPALCEGNAISVKPGDYETIGYRSSDGVSAVLMVSRFGNAYLQLNGIHKDIDNLVMEVSERGHWGEKSYKTTLFGSRYTIMTKDGNTTKVFNPFKDDWIMVTDDEALSGYEKTKSLVSLHETQKKDGLLKKAKSFNRPIRQKFYDNNLKSESKRIEDDCGFKTNITIDWKTVKDENFTKTPSPGSCLTAAMGLRTLCSGHPMTISKKKLAKIKKITCKISDKNRYTLKGRELIFEYNNELVNAEKFASYTIYNSVQ